MYAGSAVPTPAISTSKSAAALRDLETACVVLSTIDFSWSFRLVPFPASPMMRFRRTLCARDFRNPAARDWRGYAILAQSRKLRRFATRLLMARAWKAPMRRLRCGSCGAESQRRAYPRLRSTARGGLNSSRKPTAMRPALRHDRLRFRFLKSVVRHRRDAPLLEYLGRLRPNHRAWAHRAMQSCMPEHQK